MTQIVDYKMFQENEFENRLSVIVRYRNESYAVTLTTFHDFENNEPIVKHINSFGYLTNVSRSSAARDKAIKNAIIGMKYQY